MGKRRSDRENKKHATSAIQRYHDFFLSRWGESENVRTLKSFKIIFKDRPRVVSPC
jgi:hypothetical protein